jgi:Queuine tRNA-ribosyltransferase
MKKLKFIPIINSNAGASLTLSQWKQTGSTHFAFDVLNLLLRPGLIEFKLKSPGISIVDCRNLLLNAKKQVRFKRPDGSYQSIEMETLIKWLESIAPDAVIWPFENIFLPLPQWTEDQVSDQPAIDAIDGRFYFETTSANILDSEFEKDLGLLDKNCQCETCAQGFTRAYLHHLFEHTPLLAQRFLLSHNVFFSQLHGIRAE